MPRGAAGRRHRQPVPGLRGPAAQLGCLGCGHLPGRQVLAGRAGGVDHRGGGGPLRATVEIRRRILTAAMCSASGWRYNSAQIDVNHRHRLADRHTFLKVAFPVDVLHPGRHLRDPVGQHRAPHPPQHQLGLGALRDLRAEVGGPERRRLRRQPAQRLQVWPRHQGQRDPHQPAARAGDARPHRRPGPAPLRLQPAAPPGRWNEATVAAAYALNDPLLARQVAGMGSAGAQTADRAAWWRWMRPMSSSRR
jgi:hypothetical protein